MATNNKPVIATREEDTAAAAEAVKQFERAWRDGLRPVIEEYLPPDGAARRAVLIGLVHVELECRLKAGEPARVDEYLERFPGLAEDRGAVVALSEAGYEQRQRVASVQTLADFGGNLNPDIAPVEYCERLPRFEQEIHKWMDKFPPGQRIDDFEIVRLLGSGGFANVYLARQTSLDRLVALKVSANQGSEARTLAQLEHAHIVQVFTEKVDVAWNLRLLCMQFVSGLTLQQMIDSLKQHDAASWNGRAILSILDQQCTEATTLDLGGLANRALLESYDQADVACWMGARLAEALAHAHNQGVLHRDIKPANILINRYGRPLLADFNIAVRSTARGHDEGVGGTLDYMAPEHLEAFDPWAQGPADAVDARADIYSLGVVLFLFLTGELPFGNKAARRYSPGLLQAIANERRSEAPSPRRIRPQVPELLDRVVRRCLDPDPARRFQSAADLSRTLDGCRELQRVEQEVPLPRPWLRGLERRPFTVLIALAVLPNLLGSVFNVAYNHVQIVETLSASQRASFRTLVLGYNAVVYPLMLLTAVFLLRRLWRGCHRLQEQMDLPTWQAAQLRRQALALPGWVVLLAALGWFSGGVVFPLGLHYGAQRIRLEDGAHFLISFVLSGMIAMTYSYFGVQFVVLRRLYPHLWSDPADARQQAQVELVPVAWQLRFFQFLAGLIPLMGAVLLISLGREQLSLSFRVLVVALIVLGIAGFGLATMLRNYLDRVRLLLTGGQSCRIAP